MIDDLASFSTCSPQSIITNAIINGKIEAKKLELSKTKCVNIHIGEHQSYCEGLKAHENSMKKKTHETYLGDIICSSGTNNRNVEKRCSSGIGAVSDCISMLGRVALGNWHFQISKLH